MSNEEIKHESEGETIPSVRTMRGWLTLQRIVAIAMIVVNAIPMVFILKQFIPPLAIANVLFIIVLLLTWLRPRAGAIGIGVLSVLWMLLNLVNFSQVIPDITRPSETLFFLVTIAHLLLPVAGIVGFIGVLKSASDKIAYRTLGIIGAVMIGSLVFSLLVSL
ncbi:hypothetical protein LG329_09805 [Virgibacillus necropolis]|uniref:hypothetical protein n=1 Tax=Virgibacillus necropolis TaxID=163877 RepID=UPI00384CF6D8